MASPGAYVIVTHSLVWYFEDGPELSPAARAAFKEVNGGHAVGIIPTIVLAEIIHLQDRGRIPVRVNEIIAALQKSTNFAIVGLDLATILQMIQLKPYELHDRVILATAKSLGARLITKDEHLRRSAAVPCVW